MRPGERKQLGRPPLERVNIERHVRGLIISGKLAPGARVPSVAELSKQHRASSKTVHEALVNLAGDGFLVAKSTRGTFVTDYPPHLWEYAIANPIRSGIGPGGGSLMYAAIDRAVQAIADHDPRRRIRIYKGIDELFSGEDDYYRLLEDVRAERVAGIIFFTPPLLLRYSELIQRPSVPMVTLGVTKQGALGEPMAGVMPIPFDQQLWFARATEHLAKLGCERIAVMGNVGEGDITREHCRRIGIESPPYLNQPAYYRDPTCARRAIELMFSPDMRKKPDGLIISDDHFIAPAIEGMRIARIHVPRDVKIVAMFNYPHLVKTDLSFHWLGFDARESVRHAIEVIDDIRAGRNPSPGVVMPKFLDEIENKLPD